jgi:hypothetical protein
VAQKVYIPPFAKCCEGWGTRVFLVAWRRTGKGMCKAVGLDAFVVGAPVDYVLLDGFHIEVLGQGLVGERWKFFV